jgi:N-acetylglucosaminyldiphosphoundecaprenol N-acetyl-beta-D-mannosaminyltransferase
MKKISCLGISLSVVSLQEIADTLYEFATNGPSMRVVYVNAHCVNIASSDARYRGILNSADLAYADGQGVVWAWRSLTGARIARVNIIDFFDALAQQLKAQHSRVYLLGAAQEVVSRAAEVLRERGLKVVGFQNGFYPIEHEESVVQQINSLHPDIVMVGMGVPKQELWIQAHAAATGAHLCWGVGGFFDILAGRYWKTPGWVSHCGLEWLYLGVQNPGRMWKRYIVGNIVFVCRVMVHKMCLLRSSP